MRHRLPVTSLRPLAAGLLAGALALPACAQGIEPEDIANLSL
jgi:hypothetical protein